MTREQINLVEDSWDFIVLNTAEAGKIFYARLFELDPSLRELFKEDMESQARKLVSLITFVVHKLDNLDVVINDVVALGKRHAGYKVKDSHYDTVGEALLWTLQKALKNRWTPEMKTAWLAVYTLLANTMIKAMQEQNTEVSSR